MGSPAQEAPDEVQKKSQLVFGEPKKANEIVAANKAAIQELFGTGDGKPVVVKDIETTQRILNDLHTKAHIPSLTNVSRKEIDAVRLARGMNMLAKSPLISQDIDFFLDIKRSEIDPAHSTNMLQGVFNIATQFIDQGGDKIMRKMGLTK